MQKMSVYCEIIRMCIYYFIEYVVLKFLVYYVEEDILIQLECGKI